MKTEIAEDLIPIFKTWNQLYGFVLVELLLFMAIFYGITIYFQ